MRQRTGHRRLVRGFGAFLSASLIAGSAAIGLGAGVASAQVSSSEGSSTWALAPNTAASMIPQNTAGYQDDAGFPSQVGAGAGWTFTIQGDWDVNDTFEVNVDPGTYAGTKGEQCRVPYTPRGVNQSDNDLGNYIGFSALDDDVTIPVVESTFPAGPAPTFDITVVNPIACSNNAGKTAYRTLRLTATNSGNGQASQNAIVNLGWSTNPPPPGYGPVFFDVGFGATTGPAFFSGGGSGTAAFAVESSVTVMGERPSANEPRSTLVRNTATDNTGGPIAEFKITENYPNSLPPADGHWPVVPPGPGATDLTRHILTSFPPGDVCLSIDNSNGNQMAFGSTLPAWAVDPGASAAGNSAAAGPDAVSTEAGGTILRLPVQQSSNKVPTVWTTTGLNLAGKALVDGPIWAYVYWAPNDTPCTQVETGPSGIYSLGYVQLATVSEVANAIFGADAESTAAQAVGHQFDYHIDECVSNNVWKDYIFGPSIFVARSDDFVDGLGAAYAAGSVQSGVLLTPTNSLHPATKDQIRLQGVQTVFVAGGPLAISDAVVNELKSTPAYHCGGSQPRLDPNTGLPKNLVVIRIYGQTWMDTNQRLAEFVGAQPNAAFGAFGANKAGGNPFNTAGGISQAGTPPVAPVNTALLVTGEAWQDAAVASVPAYGNFNWQTPLGQFGPMPLIATPSNSLSQQAINAMFNQHIQQLIVVGGPMAISDNVINAALAAIPGLSVIRIAGPTASATSVQLAMFELSPLAGEPNSLGMGFLNVDDDWGSYVSRTAGNINFNNNDVTAHVVLVARGDYFSDAMAAAAVLSLHYGCRGEGEPEKFPLILTESSTVLGTAAADFLKNGSTYISTLTGANPSNGNLNPIGIQKNMRSSNVFTAQPIGGPLALSPALLGQIATTIGS